LSSVFGQLHKNNTQQRGLEYSNSGAQKKGQINQEVYSSHQSLGLSQAGPAGAYRYQSVGSINLPREASCGVSAPLSTSQGAVPPTQTIVTGGGSTSLPGLKHNLQTMKSSKQLAKMTPNDQLMSQMILRQAVKMNTQGSSQMETTGTQQLASKEEPQFLPSTQSSQA